jgi:hypothetical protein
VACLASNGEVVRLRNDGNLDWTYRAGHDVPDVRHTLKRR